MKTLFTIIILFTFLSINLYAQNAKPINNNNKISLEKIKSIESYNAQARALNIEQVLDSNFTVSITTPAFYTSKGSYFYDLYGRDTLDVYYTKNHPQTTWLVTGKHQNKFNTNDQIIETIHSIYKPTSSSWNLIHKSEYSYNNNGNLILVNNFEWDTISSTWVPKVNSYISYNSSGNISETRDSSWNSSSNSFILRNTAVYTYYANGNIKTVIYSGIDYNSTVFKLQTKAEYTYNAQNKETSFKTYRWNTAANMWLKHYKREMNYYANQDLKQLINFTGNNNNWDTTLYYNYTFNSSGKLASRTEIIATPNPTIPNNRTLFSYDANLHLIYELHLNYNTSTQQYSDSVYYTNYTIDSYGNATQKNLFAYNSNNNTWIASRNAYYSFNTNYLNSNLIYPFDTNIDTNYKYMPLSEKNTIYDTISSTWYIVDSTNYFFSAKNIDFVEALKQTSVRAFPNPAKDIVYFKLPVSNVKYLIDLYDITGKLIRHEQMESNQQLSVGDLKAGVYLFKITGESQIYSGKFIVE
jgi:hypothetical protein